jgi:hypothetical protein
MPEAFFQQDLRKKDANEIILNTFRIGAESDRQPLKWIMPGSGRRIENRGFR